MYEALIALLTFVTIVTLGGAALAFRAARKRPIRDRLGGPDAGAEGAAAPGTRTPQSRMVESIGVVASLGGVSARLRQTMAEAGWHGRHAASLFLGAKVLLLVAGLAGSGGFVMWLDASLPVEIFVVVAGAALLSFVPNVIVRHQRAKRQREVRHHLPDALDLLEICISSGMGMDTAWNAVADEIRPVSATLADEMALANLELHLGAPREDVLRHMAARTRAEEISSLVGVLVQSERFGTSVSVALRVFAESLREERSFRARENAEKAAVKLLIPMVTLIFPVIVMVAIGPTIIVLRQIGILKF